MYGRLCATIVLIVFLTRITSAAPIQTILKVEPADSEDIIRNALIKAEIILDGELVLPALALATSMPDVWPVLPRTFTPTVSLSITYQSSDTSVSLGNDIPVPSVSARPLFTLSPLPTLPSDALSPTRTLAANKTFTLVLTDPDATSRANPVKAQMCHWIITGIKLQSLNSTEGLEGGEGTTYALNMRYSSDPVLHGTNNISGDRVEEIIKYFAPAPPPKTGRHRYVFILLEPEVGDGNNHRELRKPKDRPHWGYEKQGQGVMDWAAENGLSPVGANFFYAQHKKQ